MLVSGIDQIKPSIDPIALASYAGKVSLYGGQPFSRVLMYGDCRFMGRDIVKTLPRLRNIHFKLADS